MKHLLLCIFSFSSSCALAQVKDTLLIPQSSLHENYSRVLEQNPLQAENVKLSSYTETTLSHRVVDSGLKRVQTPAKKTQYGFNAKGIYNANENIRLYGKFQYEHLQEKNMGYNLSSRRTDTEPVLNPNYLFVPKASDWETQNYDLFGGASFKVKDLRLGADAYYNAQSSYRKSDPRPAVLTADYGATLRAGYQLGKHLVTLHGGLGRTTENNEVMAVNEYINAPAYPDTYVRFSNGYGRVINFSSYSDFLYQTDHSNFGGGYQFSKGESQLNLNYNYQYDLEKIYGKDANSQVYLDPALLQMKYRTQAHEFTGSYLSRWKNKDILAQFGASIKTGDNYNKVEDGQNYRMTSDKFYLYLQTLSKNKNGLLHGVRFKNDLHFFRAQDLLGTTDKISDSWTLSLSGLKELYQNEKSNLSLELGIKQYLSLKNTLSYNATSSSTLFYDHVIRPDYLYDGLNKTGAFAEISFLGKLKKSSHYKIFANFEGLFKNENSKEINTLFTRPQSAAQFGLVIYY